MLELINCNIGFYSGRTKTSLLNNVSLTLKKAEMVSLVGLNGSGKTSLLRTIMRIQKLLSGEILLNGKNIHSVHAGDFPLLAGYVSTEQLDSGEMTVKELVALGRYPFSNWIGSLSEKDYSIIHQAIEDTGLTGLQNKRIVHLSDGERQRAMIARILAQNTPLVLLDEPTAFLDVPHKIEIIRLLRKLCDDGKTVLFSTHDIDLAVQTSDKLAVIHDQTLSGGVPEDMILKGLLDKFSIQPAENQKAGQLSVFMPQQEVQTKHVVWTIKALNRSKILVSKHPSDSLPVITLIEENGGFIWNLQRNGQNLLCYTIEELLFQLKNK